MAFWQQRKAIYSQQCYRYGIEEVERMALIVVSLPIDHPFIKTKASILVSDMGTELIPLAFPLVGKRQALPVVLAIKRIHDILLKFCVKVIAHSVQQHLFKTLLT